MSYVDSNLMPNETVMKRGTIHWFIFVPGAAALLVGLMIGNGFGALVALVGAAVLVRAFIIFISTELAVTNKRVIAKFGFIKRSTVELNHNKVEGLTVDQSILGRILGFGTVVVSGTGGMRAPVPAIADPLAFRKEALAQVELAAP